MHASDAKSAIAADGRYSLEPRDPKIRAEADAFVAQMQQDREAAAKRAADAAAKAQARADYVQAWRNVHARHVAAAAAAVPKAVAPATPPTT
jgi:hypothetical protein